MSEYVTKLTGEVKDNIVWVGLAASPQYVYVGCNTDVFRIYVPVILNEKLSLILSPRIQDILDVSATDWSQC